MFDNIGEKLKKMAKVFCWIGIIGSVVLAISYFVMSKNNDGFVLTGLIVLFVGCLVSWASNLALYGFGELIDRIISIDNKLGKKGSRIKDIVLSDSSKSNKSEKQLEEESGKPCQLCGIRTDKLVEAYISDHNGARKIYVCEECAQANKKIKRMDGHSPTNDNSAEQSVKNTKPRDHLLKETENGRKDRLNALANAKKEGPPFLEKLFLDDIETEKTIKKIYELWSSYEFNITYPEIDACLIDLKEKEKKTGPSSPITKAVKEELKTAFSGGEIGLINS